MTHREKLIAQIEKERGRKLSDYERIGDQELLRRQIEAGVFDGMTITMISAPPADQNPDGT